jgi:DNA repair protein RecO
LVRLDRVEPRQSPLNAATGRADAEGAQVLGQAAYFAELLDEWAPEGQVNERLFRLGAAVGDALCLGGSVESLARYFEYWLLRLEGVYPALDACARCGRPTLGACAVLVANERCYACVECASGGLRLSPAAVAFLAHAGVRTPAEMTAAGAAPGPLREIEQVHHQLIAMHLEKELRSARVVKELRPQP